MLEKGTHSPTLLDEAEQVPVTEQAIGGMRGMAFFFTCTEGCLDLGIACTYPDKTNKLQV